MNKNKKLFVQWLALPKANRQPKTQKELAPLLNVRPETLSRWKNEPGLMDQVYQELRAHLETYLPEVMHVIGERASQGEIKFIILLLELLGKYTDSITVTAEVPQIGIEQYSAVIKQVAEWEQERFGNGNGRHEELPY